LYTPCTHYIIINNRLLFLSAIAIRFLLLGILSILFSRNSIYRLFNFVLIILASLFILLFLNLQFLPLTFLIIYIGAIAVLFLFIIIILQVKSYEIKPQTGWLVLVNLNFIVSLIVRVFLYYLSILGSIHELITQFIEDFSIFNSTLFSKTDHFAPLNYYFSRAIDTRSLLNLFTDYAFFFWLVILILLIAIIRSILLTTSASPQTK
jgi:NADH-quinone oxidoreductase subunit J